MKKTIIFLPDFQMNKRSDWKQTESSLKHI